LREQIHITGTVQKNRRGLPNEFKKKLKMKPQEIISYERNEKVMVLAWQDKRQVLMLSTYHGNKAVTVQRKVKNTVIDIQKPTVIIDYTAQMGAVDHANQMAASYNFARKSLKWWRKMFFWSLELAVINSYILFNITQERTQMPKASHLDYRRALITQLVGTVRHTAKRRGRPSTSDRAERLDAKTHFLGLAEKQRDCAVCSNRKVKGGRHLSLYFCKTCTAKPALHPVDCFEAYHSREDYKQ
jgi:Transposase IS4